MDGLGVTLWDRRASKRLGEPEVDRLDTAAGEVESDAHGADRSESSRGVDRTAARCGDGEEAEVTEETDGFRSNDAGHV